MSSVRTPNEQRSPALSREWRLGSRKTEANGCKSAISLLHTHKSLQCLYLCPLLNLLSATPHIASNTAGTQGSPSLNYYFHLGRLSEAPTAAAGQPSHGHSKKLLASQHLNNPQWHKTE